MVARRVGGDGLCALKVPSSNGRTFFRVKGIEMDIGIMSEAEWNRVFYASAPTEVGAEVFLRRLYEKFDKSRKKYRKVNKK